MPSPAVLVATALLLAVGFALPQGADAWVSSSYSVNCESKKGRYKACPVPWTAGGVRLVEQRSKAACTRGYSWGYTGEAVWVDKGCHGLFAARDPYQVRRITCQSSGESTRQCTLGGSPRRVTLIRDLGQRRCKQGKNWDYNHKSIWVANRCGGVFEVEYR